MKNEADGEEIIGRAVKKEASSQ